MSGTSSQVSTIFFLLVLNAKNSSYSHVAEQTGKIIINATDIVPCNIIYHYHS